MSEVHAGDDFEALGRTWRIAEATEPTSGLQSLLPWCSLIWPIAAGLVLSAVVRGAARRRKAERHAERIFDLSVDLFFIAARRPL